MSDDLVTAARKAVKAIDDMRLGISVHNGRMPTSNYPITGPVVNALTEAWIDLNAAIDALPPSIEERKTVGVKVKPLEWHAISSIVRDKEAGRSDSIVGRYTVIDGMGWGPEPTNTVWHCGDNTDAKARCQRDYEARILSTLEPISAPQCCMCGKTGLSTVEGDGGTECELSDGRWVCSQECYDRALEPLPEAPIPESEEDAETLLIYLRGSLSRTGRDGFVDVPRSYIDQAIALLSSPPIPDHVDADVMGGDWQLIETVPKDGRLILLWDEDCGHPVVAGWSNNHQCFVEQYGGRDPAPDTDITGCKVYLPTHWMPLAAAPKPSGDESGKGSDLTKYSAFGGKMQQREAWWTFDAKAEAEGIGRLYYIGLTDRRPPPYRTQRHVTAILDIAADGTLAGVELINDMPPPPPTPENNHG